MRKGAKVLLDFKKRWQLYAWLKVIGFAMAPLIVLCGLEIKFWILPIVFVALLIVSILLLKPFKIGLTQVVKFIDTRFIEAEYSAALLLKKDVELSNIGRLQKEKIAQRFQKRSQTLQPPVSFKSLVILLFCCLLIGFGLQYFGIGLRTMTEFQHNQIKPSVKFTAADSTSVENDTPAIANAAVDIRYPNYTGIGSFRSDKMDIEVLENSQVHWTVDFDQKIDSVILEFQSHSYKMKGDKQRFEIGKKINEPVVYNFRYFDSLGNEYISDLHGISVFEDENPVIEIENLDQFTSFNFSDEKKLQFSSRIKDDFGIDEAYIIATVSKGSGESVKFREERIEFQQSINSGAKSQEIFQEIDMDRLNMEPGDELYFYVEALDLKEPIANVTRSETYFAEIKDTVKMDYMESSGMGVDLLPDYFRSQRQLIIDTEKLINEKPEISRKEFESRSNNLGFDQKTLRLKYGQFMGDEAEGSLASENAESLDGEEDLLAAYSHRHDSDNEHNLVEEHEHGHKEEEEDPLEKYVHNHEDPEESTLFAKSLKTQLRQAINQMWDAELQLRIYEPKASLEYQYRALELIQNIKNSSRIYVHRIGFDPPPLKEDKRLTGELKDVGSYQTTQDYEQDLIFEGIRKAIAELGKLQESKSDKLSERSKEIFNEAGIELAREAIEKPGQFLGTLKALKKLSGGQLEGFNLQEIQHALWEALPKPKDKAIPSRSYQNNLDQLMLEELEAYEQ